MIDRKLSILIVDDEFWIRENIKSLIEWDKLDIEFHSFAENGEKALEIIAGNDVDIVITDVNIPIIKGDELIKRASSLKKDIVFIAISGYSDFGFVRSSLIAGAIDYLLKPIVKSDLNKTMSIAIEKVKNALDKKDEKLKIDLDMKIASSVIEDREFSRLLSNDFSAMSKEKLDINIQELELKFAGFVMIVVRIYNDKKSNNDSLEEKIYYTKKLLKEEFNNAYEIIFNNVFKMEEFIIITNSSNQTLQKSCENIYERIFYTNNTKVSIIISDYYFSFSHIIKAYKDINVSAMMIQFGHNDKLINVNDIKTFLPSRIISQEEEKQLEMAIKSKNRDLFGKVLFEQINLKKCFECEWVFAEVRQALEIVSWLLKSNLPKSKNNESHLVFDNLNELLRLRLERYDKDEIYSILDQMQDEVFKNKDHIHNDSVQNIVLQIKDYVDCCYTLDISLIDLSKNFNIDSTYLSKVFKQVSGDNLMLYISKKRIDKAKEYLTNTNLSITEISNLVGYSDYGYFSRVFKKVSGISPSAYREKGAI